MKSKFMAITAADIKIKLSGGANNASPDGSLGGVISAIDVDQTTTLHNIFDKVIGRESRDGDEEYRILYIQNTSLLDAERCYVFFTQNEHTFVSIGVRELVNITAATLANEDTAPDPEVTFTSPATEDDALLVGDIPAGQARALYLKRVIPAGTPADDLVNLTFRVELDSPE